MIKKVLWVFIIIFMFCAVGCSSQYQSERYLYRATKLAKNILVAPEAVPPQEFNRALNAYKIIFEKYPDTEAAKRARVATGSLYLSKEEHDKAREVFTEVLTLYPDDQNICLEARFAIGKSYENQGAWDKALSKYREIMKEYPSTGVALSLPIYIATHYEKEENVIEKNRSYMQAISYYEKIARENPNSELGYRAQNFITMCYMKLNDWTAALENLRKIGLDYPMARNLGITMRMIGDISIKRLNDPQKAVDIFEEFLEKNPDHPAKEPIKKGLEELRNVHLKQ